VWIVAFITHYLLEKLKIWRQKTFVELFFAKKGIRSMTWAAALPSASDDEPSDEGEADAETVITFVVPAPTGCDLSCPFCYIGQRGEQTASTHISEEDYALFVREIDTLQSVRAVCIQGYEPLLPNSFSYTPSRPANVLASQQA